MHLFNTWHTKYFILVISLLFSLPYYDALVLTMSGIHSHIGDRVHSGQISTRPLQFPGTFYTHQLSQGIRTSGSSVQNGNQLPQASFVHPTDQVEDNQAPW